MHVVRGRPALSAARRARMFAKAKSVCDGLAMMDTCWVHLVVADRELASAERTQLEQMLAYGPAVEPMLPSGAMTSAPAGGAPERSVLWIAPRLGTTSPWSSKATDIAHVCGLPAVKRIERALEYTLHGSKLDVAAIGRALSDRMTETVVTDERDLAKVIASGGAPRPLGTVALGRDGAATLREASKRLGLALSPDEIEYLVARYGELRRDPTDVELMMFAQANSEHCRHKIFNAEFWIDGVRQEHSLFQLIKQSTAEAPGGVLSAYKDNAAVVTGNVAERFFPDHGPEGDGVYRGVTEPQHILGKVETHNHPTAISPFPGAATGSGGEIRDEGATGRGAKPKAGLVGFTVSDLRIPGALEPWEAPPDKWIGSPARIASALEIMTEGPLGGAAFNNEFGRPAILGYFRSYEHGELGSTQQGWGYHKPVMLAGGIGAVRPGHVKKGRVPDGAALIVLGGPAFLIGLGGGAASSVAQGSSTEDLDFASVQRDNAEIQRRCQEVIDRCWALGDDNPIASIHDVGAGGLSNAMPELVHDAGLGAKLELRAIPSGEPDLSPLELWSNEAQERYVLAIPPARVPQFAELCARERAPWAQLGTATPDGHLLVSDKLHGKPAVDIPLELMLGKPPKMIRRAETVSPSRVALQLGTATVAQALDRVLGLPTVADKTFLVTIGDRTVGGMVSRDPMIGRFQVPVADHALTLSGFDTTAGEVMALGERPPVAQLDAAAASRLAIAETVTNLASAPIGPLGRIKLSCNWMAAAGHPGEDAKLYAAVRAASECAVALGMAIPVGKDSMSMRTQWGGAPVSESSGIPTAVKTQGTGPRAAKAILEELEREIASENKVPPPDPEMAELDELAKIASKRWREAQAAVESDPDDLVTTGRFTRRDTNTDDLSTERSDRFKAEKKILGPAPEFPNTDDLSTSRRKSGVIVQPRDDDDENTIPWAERDLMPTYPGDVDDITSTQEWPNPLDPKTGEWPNPLHRGRDASIAAAAEASIAGAVAAADALSDRLGGGTAGYVARGLKLAPPARTEPPKSIVSPVTLVVTAFGPVTDVRLDVTPELRGAGHQLLLIDLGAGKNRLGGSCLAQVYDQLGDIPPDLDDPKRLLAFYDAIQQLVATRKLTAYHDRSDGGLAATVLEMAFASGLGLELDVTAVGGDPFAALFSEELGAVIEVADADVAFVRNALAATGAHVHVIGRAVTGDRITISHNGAPVVDAARSDLRARWSRVTHALARRRDDASCADEEHATRVQANAPGLTAELTFTIAPAIMTSRPRVAILREQGVNGQIEMAAAFTRAGFDAVDVHMTDLIEGRVDLSDMRGAVACGGFSFGDVLGAGRGWAATFRYNPRVRDALAKFTARTDTFLLGVCNGCQALADLADQLPGASQWPRFVRNRSEQFEARLVLLKLEKSPSIFFAGMSGSRIPVASAHGEGRAELTSDQLAALDRAGLVAARFVDGAGNVASTYPANPNGSPGGIAALTTADGRLTIMMPHPERVHRTMQLSWHPREWRASDDSPWMQMFYNARRWVG